MKKLITLTFLFTITLTAAAQHSRSLQSDWEGTITIMGNQLPITTHFTGDDSLRGTIEIQGATLPLQNIRSTASDSVFFEFTTSVNVAKFKGTFTSDSTLAGDYYQAGQQFAFKLKRVEPKAHQQNANDNASTPIKNVRDSVLAGSWKGTIETNVPLRIKTNFRKQDDGLEGTIEIQGTTLVLQKIAVTDDDSVHFEFKSGNGLATFRGSFTSDTSIAGDFMQKGFTFPFKLHRAQADTMAATVKEKPLPYHHQNLIIKNDSIDIGGTLTWPKNKQSDQLVIMISGSGAQDRDEATPVTDFKPFAELADSLTVHRIATFRYDDRGVGKSTGSLANATLDILASDVKAIIDYFSNSADHHFNTIVLLGHSQGGVVAGKVAANDARVDKLILMGSTGISLKEVLHYQVKQAFLSEGITDSTAEDEIMAREDLMEAIHAGKDIEQTQKIYRTKFKAIQLAGGVDSARAESLTHHQTKTLTQVYGSPQMQSLLFYDPTDDLKQLNIPVLALFGSKDTQVLIRKNKPAIEAALKSAGVPYQIKIIKNANHLFQHAKTGQVQEYGSLENRFVNGFLTTLEEWIKRNQ